MFTHKDNNEADKCNMSYKIDCCPVEELQGILILSNENDLGVEYIANCININIAQPQISYSGVT